MINIKFILGILIGALVSVSAFSEERLVRLTYERVNSGAQPRSLRSEIREYLNQRTGPVYDIGKMLLTREAVLWKGESSRVNLEVKKRNAVMIEYRVKF